MWSGLGTRLYSAVLLMRIWGGQIWRGSSVHWVPASTAMQTPPDWTETERTGKENTKRLHAPIIIIFISERTSKNHHTQPHWSVHKVQSDSAWGSHFNRQPTSHNSLVFPPTLPEVPTHTHPFWTHSHTLSSLWFQSYSQTLLPFLSGNKELGGRSNWEQD